MMKSLNNKYKILVWLLTSVVTINNTKAGQYRLSTTDDGSPTISYKSEYLTDTPQSNNT